MNGRFQMIIKVAPALLVMCGAGFFVWYPISDGDVFWHLAAGREMVSGLRFLFTDPFSFTNANAPWTDLHWLYQVVVFTVTKYSGMYGLLLFNSLVFGLSCAILLKSFRFRTAEWAVAGFLLILMFEIRYLVPMRPVVFTLMYISLFFFLLETYRIKRKIVFLILLLPVQILWVNSQGLFMLGPVIYVGYMAGEFANDLLRDKKNPENPDRIGFRGPELKTVLLIFCALLLVNLLNPYGFKAFNLSLLLFRRIEPGLGNIYSVNIPENAALLSLIGTQFSHFAWLVTVLVMAAVITTVYTKKVRLSLVFVPLCFLPLAVMAQRNIPLFVFSVLPLVVWNCAHLRIPDRYPKKIMHVIRISMSIILLCGSAFFITRHAITLFAFFSGPVAPFSFPSGSVSYFKSHDMAGALFNADRFGGYLIWNLYPERKVYIDTRLAIRSRAFFAEYLDIIDNPHKFTEVDARYNFGAVVLPLANVDRYFTLASYLFHDRNWRLAFTDGAEALFVKDTSIASMDLHSNPVIDSIITGLKARFADHPALLTEAKHNFGRFLGRIGCCSEAGRVLAQVQGAASRVTYAFSLAQCGALDSAVTILEQLAGEQPGFYQARIALARIYAASNNFQKALENVIFVLKRKPFNNEARTLIRIIHTSTKK